MPPLPAVFKCLQNKPINTIQNNTLNNIKPIPLQVFYSSRTDIYQESKVKSITSKTAH